MESYRQVYDSHHLQADCHEPGSAPEPYARQSSMDYGLPLPFFMPLTVINSCYKQYGDRQEVSNSCKLLTSSNTPESTSSRIQGVFYFQGDEMISGKEYYTKFCILVTHLKSHFSTCLFLYIFHFTNFKLMAGSVVSFCQFYDMIRDAILTHKSA